MKKYPVKLIACAALLAITLSCNQNNPQGEVSKGNNDNTSAPSPSNEEQPSTSVDSASLGNPSQDPEIEGNTSKPGEGNYISGTGANNGSGKTGGG
jgi:hypothetical protein